VSGREGWSDRDEMTRLDALGGVLLQTSLAAGGVLLAVAAFTNITHGTRIILIVGGAITILPTILSLLSLGKHPFASRNERAWIERLLPEKPRSTREVLKWKREYVWWSMALLILVVEGFGFTALVHEATSAPGHHKCEAQAKNASKPSAEKQGPRIEPQKPRSGNASGC
jgi:hypothetical protein